VWRALRGSPLVREETRRRIVETARELGFESNWIARSLSTRSSPFVGMVVPDMYHPTNGPIIEGAQDVFEQGGYQLLLMNSKRQQERQLAAVSNLRAHRVAGLLLAAWNTHEPCGLPVVYFDCAAPGGDGAVLLANREGVELLVGHLLEVHGHTRIAYLGGPAGLTSSDERLAAFQATLSRAWLAVPPEYIRMQDALMWDAASGERAVAELLALPTPPTAIVTATDVLAAGVLRGLLAAGKRVPEDVAVVSFNDPPLSDLLDPPLTALSFSPRQIGEQAARLLLEQLERPHEPEEVRIPVELLVRRSCGCG
jgi:DNA-binding LacI/PurR family transcriptional regulator